MCIGRIRECWGREDRGGSGRVKRNRGKGGRDCMGEERGKRKTCTRAQS